MAVGVWLATGLSSAGAETQTWYHIEVLVFEYLEPRHVDGEKWQAEVLPLDLDGVLELFEDIPEFEDEGDSAARAPVADAAW